MATTPITAGEDIDATIPVPVYINAIPTSGEALDAGQLLSETEGAVYGVYWRCQSFKISSTKNKLDKLVLYGDTVGTVVGPVTCDIYLSDINDKPTGSILGTTTSTASYIFSTPIEVIPGEKYVFVLSNPTGDSSNYYRFRYYGGTPYTDGLQSDSSNSGGSWSNGGSDLKFQTYTSSDLVAGNVLGCDDTNTAKLAYSGFAVTDALSGALSDVQFSGVVDGFSGLSIGTTYYLDSSEANNIATSAGVNSVKVGRAVSATELLIYQLAI